MDIPFALDPKLIHKILLTDPNEFNAAFGSNKSRTETFQEFQESLQNDTTNPIYLLKRAYLESSKNDIIEKQSLEPLDRLLLELHSAIRKLVPNRTDLHSLLEDSHPSLPSVEDCLEILPWILKAAHALVRLESEARAETTMEWIRLASATTQNDTEWSLSFLLSSIFYLIDKAELCNQDKNDFYLTKVLVPRLHNTKEGFNMERQGLHERFGEQPPITKGWISSLIATMNDEQKESIRNTPIERRKLIQIGWIKDILFQREKEIAMPEIFFLDLDHLRSIRNTTRVAAAGCALGYFACIAAGIDPEVLLKDESKGVSLVQVMNSKGYRSIDEYEQAVEDCLISLAKSWKEDGTLSSSSQILETLRGQTKSVLKGESPLIKLLDNRMKDIFALMVTEDSLLAGNAGAPGQLKSGIQSKTEASSNSMEDSIFVSKSRRNFQQRGLAFYASQLAAATELATKVANLAWELYGDEFLDAMILEALN